MKKVLEAARDRERRMEASFPKEAMPRRGFLSAAGSATVVLAVGAPGAMSARSLAPNALYERPMRYKAGAPERFAEGSTFLAEQRLFIFREGKEFHCLSAVCTHLGCTVQVAKLAAGDPHGSLEFRCPCHGSRYRIDGENYEGPAPEPLPAFALELAADDGQLIVDTSRAVKRAWRLKV